MSGFPAGLEDEFSDDDFDYSNNYDDYRTTHNDEKRFSETIKGNNGTNTG